MELFTPSALATVTGAALAVTVVTAVLKQAFGIIGRHSQIVALGLAVIISVARGNISSIQLALVALLNAFVIFTAAVGIDQALNYKE